MNTRYILKTGLAGLALGITGLIPPAMANTSYVKGKPVHAVSHKSVVKHGHAPKIVKRNGAPVRALGISPSVATNETASSTAQASSSWMFALSGLINLSHKGLTTQTLDAINTAKTLVITDHQNNPLPNASLITDFQNGDTALSALQAHQVKTPYVMLDLEDWSFTPLSEQLDPSQIVRQVSTLAHAQHIKLIVTLATDLALHLSGKGTIYVKFANSNLVKSVAPYVDVFEIQSQGLQANPTLYAQFTNAIRSQIAQANANAQVFAGFTSSERNGVFTNAELESDFYKTHNALSGYWVNAPSGSTGACGSCGTTNLEGLAQFVNWASAH